MDDETKAWAEKSKRIEEERLKAEREADELSKDRTSLAYLDYTKMKKRGFTMDQETLRKSCEKFVNAGLISVILGITSNIMTMSLENVTSSYKAGSSAMAFSTVYIAEKVLLAVGPFLAALTLIVSIVCKIKFKKWPTSIIVTSVCTLLVFGIWLIVKSLILR